MKKPDINFKELFSIYAAKYPEMLKAQERQKFTAYLYITLTLFTVSFFGIFAIQPTISTISTLRKQYADNQVVYENLTTKLQNLQTLDALYTQNADKIALVDAAIPSTAQIPVVVRKIETISQRNGLFIAGIDTGTIEYFPANSKNPPLYSYTVTMRLVGNPDNINSFIADVINFDRIISIDSIGTGRTDIDRSEISITGKVYFYAQ